MELQKWAAIPLLPGPENMPLKDSNAYSYDSSFCISAKREEKYENDSSDVEMQDMEASKSKYCHPVQAKSLSR